MAGSAASSTASEATRRAAITERLRAGADPDGFVAFDRFMEVALYGEGVGFYARTDSPFGPEGDFYTAPHASPLFARSLAARVRSVLSALSPGPPVRVVELGPGDGTLAAGVIGALARDAGVPSPWEYVLVERSPSLARRALDRAAAAAAETGVRVRLAESLGADGPFRGVVLANELLDALPARRLRWEEGRWNETGVRFAERGLVPAQKVCERPVPPPDLPRELPEGTLVEVSPTAEALLRDVADHLTAGLFIVLDYGMDEPELIAAHPAGTLEAVRRHRFVDDPLSDPGAADLSVFVNFSRVRAAAAAAGLREVAFRRQAEALGDWGLPRLLDDAIRAAPSAEAEVRTRLSAKSLMFGFERFCALELAPSAATDERVGGTIT